MPHQPAPHIAAAANLRPRRAAVAAFIGTTIEWYDFYIYDLAIVLAFGKMFFSRTLDPGTATLLSFVTLQAGFAARPIDGIILGHLGDKIGRKTMLIITPILMGVATMGIGLLPGYAQIGLWAPVGLVVLHVIQSMTVDGEWDGAVLIASESVPERKSILYSAFTQQDSPAGNLLATLMFFALSALPTSQSMLWDWRVPFLLSTLLVIVGMVIYLKLGESDDMKRVLAQKRIVKPPLKDVMRDRRDLVLLGVGTLPLIYMTYLRNNFALTWITRELGYAQDTFLDIITIVLVVQFVTQPLDAQLVSRMDTRRAICLMVLPEFLLMPVMFFAIETKVVWIALFDMCLTTIPHSMFYDAIDGTLARMFLTCVRYTGLSLTYQLCSPVVGGGTPVFVQWMLNSNGNIVGVAVSSALYTLVPLACTLVLLNRTGYRTDELSTAERTNAMELGQGDTDVSRPLTGPVDKPVIAV